MDEERRDNRDLTGASRLAVEAVKGITDLVESMHGAISSLGMRERTSGITSGVYRNIRTVTDVVGQGLDRLMPLLEPLLITELGSAKREAVLAALNGVFGDHLVTQKNPLAISMAFRREAKALGHKELGEICARTEAPLLVMIHGLCMNDRQWQRQGHDHGAMLAREGAFEPLYLHYNTGRHISENGEELATRLQELVSLAPKGTQIKILAHSMGGLVARSALYYATKFNHLWPKHVKALACLGTPHHGAPLEHLGKWVDTVLDTNPYSKPFSRLGKLRGPGITDLRYGNVRHEDWRGKQQDFGDGRLPTPLPQDLDCYAIAATTTSSSDSLGSQLIGDGLVPVNSALGLSEKAGVSLNFPESHRFVVRGCNHFDLLSSLEVGAALRHFLGK